MRIIKTYRFRLYPSRKQAYQLDEFLGIARFAYNRQLELKVNSYKENKKNLAQFDLNNSLISLKKENPFLCKLHSQVLQNINQRIAYAFSSFFNNIKNKSKAGFPRFKSKNRYDSLTYPQSGFGIKNNKLCLSKVGEIKIKLHRGIKGEIKNLIIKRTQTGKWHAYFCSEIDAIKPQNNSRKYAGIDMGLNHFYADSNGNLIDNPRCLRKSENELAKLQRAHSRKKKGSNNRIKSRIKAAKMHEKITNKRNDFLHKESRKLAGSYSDIAVESLRIKNMVKNKYLAKSIADASWQRFLQMLAYKVEETGGRIMHVNARGTSQHCICGSRVEKTLAVRTHKCSNCKIEIDRDIMSAMLIKKLAFDTSKTTAGSAESNAWGDVPIGMPMNQESLASDQ